ncbi:MAG: hypothetical protein RLY14_1447 [Planctomycetota bacterium]|jgi:hypothetical protein
MSFTTLADGIDIKGWSDVPLFALKNPIFPRFSGNSSATLAMGVEVIGR